uniref:Translation initiation factor IF-2 n=1 Tax=Schlesneria paludicola TaxID=360056 RepID=A0A7C4QWA2_9PLAN
MKIRIFALAKELNIDSKLLIEFAGKAGIAVKNVLASISPEERDQLVAYVKSHQGAAAAPAPEKPAVITRDTIPDLTAKTRSIRNIGTMVARPQPRVRPPEPAQAPPAPAAPPPSPAPAPVAAPPAPAAVVQAPAAPPSQAPAAPSAPAPVVSQVEPPPQKPVAPAPAEVPPIAVAQAAPAAVEQPAAPAPSTPPPPAAPATPPPLSRSDYIPPGGASKPLRVMPPMQARGTSDTSGSRQLQKKPRQPNLPQIASVPEFKGPLAKPPKPEEPKAQQPEIRLTPEQIKSQSPLGEAIRRRAEAGKRKADEDLAADIKGFKGDRLGGVGLEEGRAQRRDRRRQVRTTTEEESEGRIVIRRRRAGARPANIPLKTSAEVELPITVRTLSEALGRPAKTLMQVLWDRGDMVTINTVLTENEAQEIALELGVDLQIRKPKDLEDELTEIFQEADPPETLQPRPPIVTILGHVDHGKTTLVDKIRSANVAATEFGGITQHIAAYQVEHNGHRITFVDTPGHAAFGEMRARGANVTDIVVLVVAANDGVMPQTVECISHARAAGVPIIVALNKIDLPDRNEQRVLQDLATHNVLAAEWGGDVEVVRTSGLTGQGVPELLDTILLTADLHEFKANPSRPGCGVCLEAFRDEGKGPIAWLIVQKGSLRVGDVVLCGEAYGRIRAMYNDRNEEIREALPSTPVKVAGLDVVPRAGDRFLAVDDIDLAREIAEQRRQRGRTETLASRGNKRTLEDILNAARAGQVQDLNLILKADTPGSLEALRHEIRKFEHPEVRVKVLHEGIGGVNESDVYLAAPSGAVIIAFHVIAEDRAARLAEEEGVEIRRYNIIYEVVDEIRRTLEGMLKPEQREVTTGRAIVLRLFNIGRATIAGCRVLNGVIERSNRVHLIREQKILNDYSIASLRREKDDAREVREGMECGIRLEGFNDIKEGDLLEAYKIEEVKRTLD